MSTDNPTPWRARFYALAQTSPDDGVRFWYARDLLKTLGCADYAPFMTVIRRAAAACEAAGHELSPHFRGVTKTSPVGKGGLLAVQDFKLSRYACHLILTVIDTRREPVAFAREYFAPPTPKPAKIEERKNDKPRADAASAQAPVAATGSFVATAQAPEPARAPEAPVALNPWQAALQRKQGNPGQGGRFIPGAHDPLNSGANPRLNKNLAVGRGYPNSAARNSR